MNFWDRVLRGPSRPAVRGAGLLLASLLVCASPTMARADEAAQSVEAAAAEAADASESRDSLRLQGRVVFLADALRKLHGVKTVDEAREYLLALQTDDETLYPLVEDVRGRAFRRDERLRKMPVELLVRRYEGVPLVQIIRVYELAEDGKYELDYWCEICAIAMFELKPCDCCQGDIELRRRKVTTE